MTNNLHYELSLSTSGIFSNYCQLKVLHHTEKQRLLELMTPLTYTEISLQFQMTYFLYFVCFKGLNNKCEAMTSI
jgi:hypothetical protein